MVPTSLNYHYQIARTNTMFGCLYCGKSCLTERGLKQHIAKTPFCYQKQLKEVSGTRSLRSRTNPHASQLNQVASVAPNEAFKTIPIRKSNRLVDQLIAAQDAADKACASGALDPANPVAGINDSGTEVPETDAFDTLSGGEDTDRASDIECGGYVPSESEDEPSDAEAKPTSKRMPNTKMMEQFKAYCNSHRHHFLPLTKAEKTQIKLMDTLKRHKAPLGAYKEVLEWQIKETKKLLPHESIRDTNHYCSRNALMKKLINRYNCGGMVPKLKQLRLPHSKATVTIPYRDAQDCIVSLLTDPRVKDKDYLFYNDDPRAPPTRKG